MVLNFGKVAAGLPSPFLFLLLASLVTAGSSGLPSGGFQMGGGGKHIAADHKAASHTKTLTSI